MGKTTEETKNKLAQMPVGRLLISLDAPAIAAQLVNLLYNMVDRIYIGHIPGVGSLALTGLGVTLPVITLISAFAALIGFGGAPRASIAMGKEDYEKAERILGNCVFTLVLLAAALTLGFFVFAEPVLYAFGASQDTIVYALPYLKIYVCGSIFVMVTTGLNAFITSSGLCGNRNENRCDWRRPECGIGPGFYFCPEYGSPGSSAGDSDFPGGFRSVGTLVFMWKKDSFTYQKEKSEVPAGNYGTGAGSWGIALYHAGNGKPAVSVL